MKPCVTQEGSGIQGHSLLYKQVQSPGLAWATRDCLLLLPYPSLSPASPSPPHFPFPLLSCVFHYPHLLSVTCPSLPNLTSLSRSWNTHWSAIQCLVISSAGPKFPPLGDSSLCVCSKLNLWVREGEAVLNLWANLPCQTTIFKDRQTTRSWNLDIKKKATY